MVQFCHLLMFHCLYVVLSLCWTVFMLGCLYVALSLCLAVFMLGCLYAVLSLCCTVFVLHSLYSALSFCCTVFIVHCLYIALSLCCRPDDVLLDFKVFSGMDQLEILRLRAIGKLIPIDVDLISRLTSLRTLVSTLRSFFIMWVEFFVVSCPALFL